MILAEISGGETSLGLLSFSSFTLSVIAAVLAIDMYTLLRTGEFGHTWRVLIIASVMFALLQALRMAEALNWRIASHGLSQIVELMFALALAYAFYLQRRAFTHAATRRGTDDRRSEERAQMRGAKNRDETASENTSPLADDKTREAAQPEEDDTSPALHDADDADIEWESHKA